MTQKLFTKSAFKVALSCPWKLFYYRNPDLYCNAQSEDEFLMALAEGGFQVGELAKCYCGVDKDADLKDILGYDESINRTNELMKRDNVTIAEAAFRFGDLFVRVDILKKRGNDIELIEVKAKSWDPREDKFLGSKGQVNSDIREYVYDVAFQKYVVTNALPGYNVKAFLMMADKSKTADVDGLNQLFVIRRNENGRTEAEAIPGAEDIIKSGKSQVLTPFDVDEVCDSIINGTAIEQGQNQAVAKAERDYQKAMAQYKAKREQRAAEGKAFRGKEPSRDKFQVKEIENHWMQGMAFRDFVEVAADCYVKNHQYTGKPALCGECVHCEFHKVDSNSTLRDGKLECWTGNGVSENDYNNRPLLEKMNGSNLGANRDKWIRSGIYFMDQLDGELKHTDSGSSCKPGLDPYQRKWLQIGLETGNADVLRDFRDDLNGTTYLAKDELRDEMATWKFPLHMIDFETTAVALPYYKGMRPYEQVAFQFSHHIIREDGSIEHVGQYLNEDVTKFPNFEFLRRLKEELEKDEGTIFRYATHENTILNKIAGQLDDSTEPDKEELITFIRSITHTGDDAGERDMVDLLEVVKRYFYNLEEMHGSNSIKQVLPAVLNCSQFLKDKYSKPIYGTEIKSLNIPESSPIAWVQLDADGHVDSPYHQLASVGELINMSEQDMDSMEQLCSGDGDFTVANGGAALTAYNKLMFCDDTTKGQIQYGKLREALLRYCELDTMSMVFIWEYFNHECNG